MPGRLTAGHIAKAAPGKMSDGGGLFLHRTETGGRWIYRFQRGGVRREMGLGPYPTVTLAAARKMRDAAAAEVAAGLDPIAERAGRKEAEALERRRVDPTLDEAIAITFEARKGRLRGEGERGRWLSPLRTHISPRLGKRRMSTLTPEDIRDAVRPIWRTKHPTALKCTRRLRMVFRGGQLMGWGVDPLTVERAVYMLGEHIHRPVKIASTPWQEAPALFARLQEGSAASDRCLAWMMLTLVRMDGCTRAAAAEVDECGVWTVPSDRIKGVEGKVEDFRVPLPSPALAYVEDARRYGLTLLFPGPERRPLSSTALEKRMTHHGQVGRPHGLRSTFRTWAQDTDACPREVSEMILGHKVYGEVEGAYARSDIIERRRPVMEAWARFLMGEAAAGVVPLRA